MPKKGKGKVSSDTCQEMTTNNEANISQMAKAAAALLQHDYEMEDTEKTLAGPDKRHFEELEDCSSKERSHLVQKYVRPNE